MWRLYDPVNSAWYDDVLYDTQEACEAAAAQHMHASQARGGELVLCAEPVDPNEPFESIQDQDDA